MMWSLTSPHAKRISGHLNFRSSPEKDFFNTIGTKRTCRVGLTMSVHRGWSQPVDATLYLEGEMECGLMGHKFHRGFTAAEKTEFI
jgi:hypothetical protein